MAAQSSSVRKTKTPSFSRPGNGGTNGRLERDLAGIATATQNLGERDAVVRGDRLGAEDGDGVAVGRQGQEIFEKPDADHAVADHDQTGAIRCASGRSRGAVWSHDTASLSVLSKRRQRGTHTDTAGADRWHAEWCATLAAECQRLCRLSSRGTTYGVIASTERSVPRRTSAS